MGKGRYLKAAERACARKARFETAASAEAFVERRYRAYRCVVCGSYHLTSGRGERVETTETPKKEPPGPRLGDLDWSAVLEPQAPPPIAPSLPKETSPSPQTLFPGGERGIRIARCAAECGKDGRALLVVEGRLVKSRPVERALRATLREGDLVEISCETPPRIVRRLEGAA